jgi:hypothetical protein
MSGIDNSSVNIGTIGHAYDGVTKLAKFIMAAFRCGNSEVSSAIDNVPNITDPYRVNRLIRSKYRAGDYVIVNPALHHYAFEIDGRRFVMGIVGVTGAIEALDKYELRQNASCNRVNGYSPCVNLTAKNPGTRNE